ncbi:MAG: DUF3078 domain-containing protein [Bacteroidetes bacterium]|nr:DUF3078 domain-containing protein [Bacteroidota bacterium]
MPLFIMIHFDFFTRTLLFSTVRATSRIGLVLLVAGSTLSQLSFAQTAPDSTKGLWKSEVIGRLAGSQVGFQNWAEGGVNTLAFSVGIDGNTEVDRGGWQQKLDAKLRFGLVKQDTLQFRKAEDLIRLSATFNYNGAGFLDKLHPTAAIQARTQFASGFNFEKNPFGDGRRPPVKVSAFLAPATITQSVGMTYQARPWISQRFGIAGKETIVTIAELRPLYNVDPDKSVRYELGIEAFTDFNKELFKNVFIKSTLGLFAAFNTPESPDLIWENVVNMKVNSWLQVNFEWSVLYDKDVSDQAQLKEVLSVGLSYHIL